MLLQLRRGGIVVRVSDLQPRSRRFESRSLRSMCNPGQVVHTHVPLFTKQYKLVPATGHRSGVALAMHHKVSGISTYGSMAWEREMS